MDTPYRKNTILSRIQDPKDLHALSVQELSTLADEIRAELIQVVSKSGGHLSSNLGVVELTLAVHSTYHSPTDRIVWDVGHQSYVHKMITGRLGKMNTIRKENGLSGFPKRAESMHDTFDTGHSSTSISASLGMARARDLKHETHHIVAIIGDGALTGGMALEAINDAGISKTNLLVILNDNGMSISKNVGGLSRYLSLVRMKPSYFKTRESAQRFTSRLPGGSMIRRNIHRMKTVLKSLFIPSMFFEDLGFRYFGPIDGHNLSDLLSFLRQIRTMNGPILLHVRTQKGKGYTFAEEDPNRYHGIVPFEVETGSPIRCNTGTWSELFGKSLLEIAMKMPDVVAITAAMPDGTGLLAMQSQFPDRVFDVGIAEQHAVTLAAGFAVSGLKPVVAIYSTFLQRAYDQILHDVCFQNLPVVFAIDRAGIVGDDGETHQGIYDLSYLGTMPNITILAPATGVELDEMLFYALTHCKGPVAIRYPRGCANEYLLPYSPLVSNRAVVVKDGSDITILAVGPLVEEAIIASETLLHENISCAVVHARFIKPFDALTIEKFARQTGNLFIIEDNIANGGFGSVISHWLLSENITCSTFFTSFPDEPIYQGTRYDTLRKYGMTADKIAEKIRKIVAGGIQQFKESAGVNEKTNR